MTGLNGPRFTLCDYIPLKECSIGNPIICKVHLLRTVGIRPLSASHIHDGSACIGSPRAQTSNSVRLSESLLRPSADSILLVSSHRLGLNLPCIRHPSSSHSLHHFRLSLNSLHFPLPLAQIYLLLLLLPVRNRYRPHRFLSLHFLLYLRKYHPLASDNRRHRR